MYSGTHGIKTIIIVSEYELVYKEDQGIFVVPLYDHPACPCCSECMNYRDSRKRIRRKEGGITEYLLVRRMYCSHCRRLHVELPDCLVPHKHYDAEVISGFIDGIVTPDDLDSEDRPCAMTMRRWIKWFFDNKTNIEGLLREAFRQAGKTPEVPGKGSMLSHIRDHISRWLETVFCIIYCSGGVLPAGSS